LFVKDFGGGIEKFGIAMGLMVMSQSAASLAVDCGQKNF